MVQKNVFQPFFSHIRAGFIQKDKNADMVQKTFLAFFKSYPRFIQKDKIRLLYIPR